MPDNREAKIRASVACPKCGARIGDHCDGHGVHISTHAERRAAWQAVRGPVPAITPTVLCACMHSATAHGSERADEFGCEKCDCSLTREAVRRAQA
jgi:hypothetical protein